MELTSPRDPSAVARALVGALAKGGRGREAEAYVSIRQRRTVEVADGRPEVVLHSDSGAASVRVLKGRRMVAAGTSDLAPAGQGALLERVASLVGLADPDDGAVLPEGTGPVVGGEVDGGLLALTMEEMEEIAVRLEAASRIRGITRVRRPAFGIESVETAVVSTRGVDARFRRARWSLSITAMASDRGRMVSGWEGEDGTARCAIDPERVGRRAAESAIAKRGGRRCPTGRFPVLFDPLTAVSLLELVGQAASAEAVIAGRSFLGGKLGARWGARGVTITDDATVPGGYGSRPADDEGVAPRRTVLVAGGRVSAYLHNARSAARMGTNSTGSAVRPSPFSSPGIGVSNLSLVPGGDGELAAAAGKAIEITELLGLHTANPVTGEVSVGIEGFLLEGGARRHPVRGGGLGTSVAEIFGGIVALGDRSRTLGGISAPAFLTGPLAVSG